MTKIKTQVLTFIAAAIALNYLGANIALFLKLPLYLDMIGTLLIALLFGPWLGAVTAIVSALLSWMTTDIFALFYAPVAIITALTAGVFLRQHNRAKDLIWKALCISFPGTLVASIITVTLFKGITSSGSSLLVQILHGLGLDLMVSVIVIQAGTDYLDRLVSLLLVLMISKALRKQLPHLFQI